jgi:hypothetical protein
LPLLVFRFSSYTKPDMQKTIDPVLAALVKCGVTYDPDCKLEHVSRGIVQKVNWELNIRTKVSVSQDLLECIRANLPHGVDVDLAN